MGCFFGDAEVVSQPWIRRLRATDPRGSSVQSLRAPQASLKRAAASEEVRRLEGVSVLHSLSTLVAGERRSLF